MLHTWLIIHAVIGLLMALALIFAPQSMVKQFGLKLSDEVGRIFARSTGAGILALAVVNWVARDYTGSDVIVGVLWANVLIHVMTGCDDLRATLNKTYKPAASGWGAVVFHGLFIIVFGFYLFNR